MKEYSQEEINKAKDAIANMGHEEMCRIWRFGGLNEEIYLRSDIGTGDMFKDRLFNHFGGFTPEISKRIGWQA